MPESPAPVLLESSRDSEPRILSAAEQAALAGPRTLTARGTGMNATSPAPTAAKRPTKPLAGPVKEIVSSTANKDGWKR
jgi:hypothetical protein